VAVRDAVTGDAIPATWIEAVSATPVEHPEAPLPPGVRVGERYLIADPPPGEYMVTAEPRPTTGYLAATVETTVVAGAPATAEIVLVRAARRATVPRLFGVLFAPARDQLAQAALAIGRVLDASGRTLDPEDWPGFDDQPVIAVDPGVDMVVPAGQPVDILLAAVPLPSFPELTGNSLANAQALVAAFAAASGLTIAGVDVVEEERPIGAGMVIVQVPIAGAPIAARSLRVRLVVAIPERAEVPSLVGRHRDEVAALLEASELTLAADIVERATENLADHDLVAEQSIAAGQRVTKGTAVGVAVWRFPHVTIPDVVGLTQAAATAALAGAGLVLASTITARLTNQVADDGQVAEQNPPPGGSVPRGSEVRLVVWRLQLVSVPNVIDSTEAVGRQMLADAGLGVGESTRPSDDPGQLGRIVTQNPGAGVQVAPGSEVGIVVAVAAPFPELRCASLEEAEARVRRFAEAFDIRWDGAIQANPWPSQRDPGTIIEQQPAQASLTAPSLADVTVLVRRAPFPDLRCLNGNEAERIVNEWFASNRVRLMGVRLRPTLSTRPSGTVLAQSPAALSAEYSPEAAAVELLVSRQDTPQPGMPDLRCLTQEEASRVLARLQQQTNVRINLRLSDAPSDRPEGLVLEQSPAPGTALPSGPLAPPLNIRLVLARPPLPDIICMDVRAARAAVEAAAGGRELVWQEVAEASDLPEGTVVRQEPMPGAPIPEGRLQVIATVSSGARRNQVVPQILDLNAVQGIGPVRAGKLRAAGIGDAPALAQAGAAEVGQALGATESLAETLIARARAALKQDGSA
jgi:beta-lactam-binding protein with PASTA domain